MATIKNLDALALELDEEERRRLEQMLQNALAEDSSDLELKNYLMSFVDGPDDDASLDAQEVWQAEVVRERFAEYGESLIQDQQDLLTGFGDLDLETSEPPAPDDLEGPTTLSNLSDWDDEPAESNVEMSGWDDEPLPESNLEVPAAFSGARDQAFELETPTAEEAPEPVTVQAESQAETVAEMSDDVGKSVEEQAQQQASPAAGAPSSPEEDDERLLKLINALGPAMAARAEGGGDTSFDTSFLGSVKRGAGATLGGLVALAEAARSSRAVLSGDKQQMSGDEMSQLRGDTQDSNVIDIRHRLGKAVNSFDANSVRERIAMIGDTQIIGRTNAMLSTMEGIDKGGPNGRYSEIELGDGMTLGGVLSLTESADPTVAAMAKSFAGRSEALNAVNEMEFLACEYQEVADALESTTDLARKQGWSEEEIADQLAKPVDDWFEQRVGEDENLVKLAELQDSKLSPEELAEREEAMKKMAEKLKQLLNKLLGRGQEQTQGVSMSR